MNLCELRPAEGSREKNWRRGRGHATGNGKTAGRGHKGQGQRSGSGGKCGFEGGQMPLSEDSLKEASHAETAKKSLLSTFPC